MSVIFRNFPSFLFCVFYYLAGLWADSRVAQVFQMVFFEEVTFFLSLSLCVLVLDYLRSQGVYLSRLLFYGVGYRFMLFHFLEKGFGRGIRRSHFRGKAWSTYSWLVLGDFICGVLRCFKLGLRLSPVRFGWFGVLFSGKVLQFHRSVTRDNSVRQVRVDRSKRATCSFEGRPR